MMQGRLYFYSIIIAPASDTDIHRPADKLIKTLNTQLNRHIIQRQVLSKGFILTISSAKTSLPTMRPRGVRTTGNVLK